MPPKPKKPRRNGRPPKLTPELQAKICTIVALSSSLEDAAAQVGVARTTVMMWQQKGREQDRGVYRDFLDAIERAKAQRRVNFNATLTKHGQKHWQALAWLAERTDPKHFGLRIRVHVNEELERIMDRLQHHLTPAEYERALEAISEPDDRSEEALGASFEPSAGGSGLASAVGAAVVAALPGAEAPGGADEPD